MEIVQTMNFRLQFHVLIFVGGLVQINIVDIILKIASAGLLLTRPILEKQGRQLPLTALDGFKVETRLVVLLVVVIVHVFKELLLPLLSLQILPRTQLLNQQL